MNRRFMTTLLVTVQSLIMFLALTSIGFAQEEATVSLSPASACAGDTVDISGWYPPLGFSTNIIVSLSQGCVWDRYSLNCSFYKELDTFSLSAEAGNNGELWRAALAVPVVTPGKYEVLAILSETGYIPRTPFEVLDCTTRADAYTGVSAGPVDHLPSTGLPLSMAATGIMIIGAVTFLHIRRCR